MTTTLNAADPYVVVINLFSVEPDKAEQLLKVLCDGTEQAINKRPGFISANFHMAMDKKTVTNYAQWRSRADIDAMMADAASRQQLTKAGELATKVEPVFYELRATYMATA